MKFILSGVTFSAAIVKSPSFSRSASSTTITMRPARISSTAASIAANWLLPGDAIWSVFRILPRRPPVPVRALPFISVCDFPRPDGAQRESGELRGADNVFTTHVALEVDAIVNLRAMQVGVLHGERDELHVESIDAET